MLTFVNLFSLLNVTLLLHLCNNNFSIAGSNEVFLTRRKRITNATGASFHCGGSKIPLSPCFRTTISRRAIGNGKMKVKRYAQGIKFKKSLGMHFAVIDNILYFLKSGNGEIGYNCGMFKFIVPSRDRRWLLQFSRILKFMKVQNFEFLFYLNDVPPLQSSAFLPTVSFSKIKNTAIFSFPFLKMAYSENLTSPRDEIFEDLTKSTIEFSKKEDLLVWVGQIKSTSKVVSNKSPRLLITSISEKHPRHIYVPKNTLSFVQQSKYKYILSLPGRGFTWYLTYALLTGSAVFIQENSAEQWYQYRLVPYVHFIPVLNDLSNLIEQIDWARKNQQKTVQIASSAREFARTYFSPEAIEAAARDAVYQIAKDYESKRKVSELPRTSFVKVCALSLASCGLPSACQQCSNCHQYNY